MFCPNCGANNSTEQKFCRSCGLNLEKTAESLLEQLPTAEASSLMRREKLIERFGNFALGGLGVVSIAAFATLVWFLVTKFLVNGTNPFAAVLLIAFIIFAFLSLIFVIFNESLKEQKAKVNSALSDGLIAKDTGKLLEEKSFQPARAASVTENSTEFFYAEKQTRKIK